MLGFAQFHLVWLCVLCVLPVWTKLWSRQKWDWSNPPTTQVISLLMCFDVPLWGHKWCEEQLFIITRWSRQCWIGAHKLYVQHMERHDGHGFFPWRWCFWHVNPGGFASTILQSLAQILWTKLGGPSREKKLVCGSNQNRFFILFHHYHGLTRGSLDSIWCQFPRGCLKRS